ncbi:BnaCnng10490D [Brassica napus]|uniref:BnaCnng10490D protein n=1 Tax=Brassica napus TaxID=3708 RepID=A0A078HXD7_BRANA|nr:BnaCnng10490D [Brassica napus]
MSNWRRQKPRNNNNNNYNHHHHQQRGTTMTQSPKPPLVINLFRFSRLGLRCCLD